MQHQRHLVLALAILIFGLPALAGSVVLAWDASACTNVIANYNIYYGAGNRDYTNVVAAGTNLTVTVSNLAPWVTYYFAATAVDEQELESDYSQEVSCSLVGPHVRSQTYRLLLP